MKEMSKLIPYKTLNHFAHNNIILKLTIMNVKYIL